MQLETWDHLRFVVAAYREGSLTRAAQALGTDQTTVTRRLRALESDLGMQLFEQLRGGVRFTAAGERLVETGLEIENQILDAERDLLGRMRRFGGTVRVTLPVIYADTFMPNLIAIRARHPGIVLEIVADDGYRNITRREADIAIRATELPPPHLVGKRVGEVQVAIFGAQSLADAFPDPASRPWIGAEGGEPLGINERWRQRFTPDAPVTLRTDHTLAILSAVRAGVGVSVLPVRSALEIPGVVQLSEAEVIAALWVLTHRETLRSARIRAAMDVLYEELTARFATGGPDTTPPAPGDKNPDLEIA